MRTFYAALIAFSLLIGAVCANAVYVGHTTTALQQRITALADAENASAALSDVEEFWCRHKAAIAFSKHGECIREMEQSLNELSKAVKQADANELEEAVRAAIGVTERIRRAEGLR